MKVLLVASEVAPIIKFGGLGDVTGSLPKALEKINVNVDVIVPYYSFAKLDGYKLYRSIEMNVPFNGQNHVVEVYNTKIPDSNVDVLLLKNNKFFNKPKVNPVPGEVSELEMYTFFSRAVVEYVKSEFNTYDIVHCNDWHTGLITHLLQDELGQERPRTLFTIHNLLYQGITGVEIIKEVGIVPGTHPIVDWDIQDGDLNMMLEGIASSDYLNTVSPSYAKEILTEDFGKNLCDLLQAREGRLSGILNGIDYSMFPRYEFKKDDRYNDIDDGLKYKLDQKQKLQEELNLKKEDAPIFCFISRLDPNQKGLSLVFDVIDHIIKNEGQFIVLGTGDSEWEAKLMLLEQKPSFKGKISINITFDTHLANRIYAGSDFILIPSRYEPCGLNQMIAMWYGTLPIVHNVGGLKDSVKDGINGFTFNNYSTQDLTSAIDSGLKIFNSDHRKLMIDHALKADFSWDRSAETYKNLFERMLAK